MLAFFLPPFFFVPLVVAAFFFDFFLATRDPPTNILTLSSIAGRAGIGSRDASRRKQNIERCVSIASIDCDLDRRRVLSVVPCLFCTLLVLYFACSVLCLICALLDSCDSLHRMTHQPSTSKPAACMLLLAISYAPNKFVQEQFSGFARNCHAVLRRSTSLRDRCAFKRFGALSIHSRSRSRRQSLDARSSRFICGVPIDAAQFTVTTSAAHSLQFISIIGVRMLPLSHESGIIE